MSARPTEVAKELAPATALKAPFSERSAMWLLAGIILVAVLVRMVYAWTLPADHLVWSDEREFDQIGWRLASTGQYQSTPYRAAPAMPFFLALVYRVAGHSYPAARLAQSVLGGVLVLWIYLIGADLFGAGIGRLAALGVACYPPLIYLSGVLYAEHLHAVLLAGTVVCLVRWRQEARLHWVALAGAGLGLCVLCRPASVCFAPLALAYAVMDPRRRRWDGGAVLVAAMVCVVGPWTARNAMVFRRFVPVSTGFGTHLWQGNNDVARGDADDRFLFPENELWAQRLVALPDSALGEATLDAQGFRAKWLSGLGAVPAGLGWYPFDRNRAEKLVSGLVPGLSGSEAVPVSQMLVRFDHLLGVSGREWMIRHPLQVLRLSGRRLVGLYSALSRTLERNVRDTAWMIAAVAFYPVLALGLVGAGAAWRRQRDSVVIHAAILGGGLVYIVTTACTRFRLPLDPFWILLASVGADAVRRAIKNGSMDPRRIVKAF
jgi:4-amino-4-deoxy-L-arabinose transferase-like glycosyltransferase